MKCTGKYIITAGILGIITIQTAGCAGIDNMLAKDVAAAYESEQYNQTIYEGNLFAENLCVANENVAIQGFSGDSTLHAEGLFDVNGASVEYAANIHERLYPASTTKILTALVALERTNLTDVVTISKNGAAASFAMDEQVCGLREGDQITMEALLYGLLLHSGNDNAVAIAEYVAGGINGFADMMNEKAKQLMATNTHFVTPNGLHDANHYTTAYDLYLIFNACIQNEDFKKMISASSYTADIKGADGSASQITWVPTNFYAKGEAALPLGATVLGGKTGYTGEAGNCLILLNQDAAGNPYISVVMGAETKPLLYEDMSALINQIPNLPSDVGDQ